MTEVRWAFDELVAQAHTALVVVDMQNDYVSAKGRLARILDVTAANEVAHRIASVLRESRRLGVHVIHTRTIHSPSTDSAAKVRKLGRDVARPGTWGADWLEDEPDLRPLEGETVITKHRFSAFVEAPLDLVLRSRGIRTLVICGCATDVCVACTARDAFMRDYHVVILSDSCAAYSEERHHSALSDIELYFGTVVDSEAVLTLWRAAAPAREASPTGTGVGA